MKVLSHCCDQSPQTFEVMSTADGAPSSLPPAASSGELITSPNPNDVLLGRGTGPNEFIGNRRFRQIVEQRKEEYKMAPNVGKTMIARQLVSHIHEAGGRFLKRVETENIDEPVWCEVEEKVALEKCSQALRDLLRKRVSPDGNDGGHHGRGEDRLMERNIINLTAPGVTLPHSSAGVRHGLVAVAPSSLSRVQEDSASLPLPPRTLMDMLPLILAGNTGSHAVDLYERLLLFRAAPFAFEETFMLPPPMATNPVQPPQFNFSFHNQINVRIPYAASVSQGLLQEQYGSVNTGAAAANSAPSSWLQSAVSQTDSVSPETDGGFTATTATVRAMSENDDALSEFLLQVFEQDSEIPLFTEEQEKIERVTMTDEEKAAALSDLFGTYCAVSTHKNKRARLELNKNSIDFLVKHMRLQLERIPLDRKRALAEAQLKCHEDEFSDARLERFLRCEGMDAKVRLEVNMCHYLAKANGLIYFGSVDVNREAGSAAVCKLLGESPRGVWTGEVCLAHDLE